MPEVERCFYCASPAVCVYEPIIGPLPSLDELISGKPHPTAITARVLVCDEHEPVAEDYFIDKDGSVGSRPVPGSPHHDLHTTGGYVRQSDPTHPAYIALAEVFGHPPTQPTDHERDHPEPHEGLSLTRGTTQVRDLEGNLLDLHGTVELSERMVALRICEECGGVVALRGPGIVLTLP